MNQKQLFELEEEMRIAEQMGELAKFAQHLMRLQKSPMRIKDGIIRDLYGMYCAFCEGRRRVPMLSKHVNGFFAKYGMPREYFDERSKQTGEKISSYRGTKITTEGLESLARNLGRITVTSGLSILKVDGKPYYLTLILRPMENEEVKEE